jgi:hypothetical protein
LLSVIVDVLPLLITKGADIEPVTNFLTEAWEEGHQTSVQIPLQAALPVYFKTPRDARLFLHTVVLLGLVEFVRFVRVRGMI